MNCYSTTDGGDERELDAFYHQLEEVIRNDKAYHKFVVGDFNTRLGMANENVYRNEKFGLGERNESKSRLAESRDEHQNRFPIGTLQNGKAFFYCVSCQLFLVFRLQLLRLMSNIGFRGFSQVPPVGGALNGNLELIISSVGAHFVTVESLQSK
ncbi:hypothetical protein KIN20_004406 [Parelaphostrongylus tenuis]|uniref:Endonuclease/exonuclease/phosphatase domain-containing protein n=1 Tax=Parelaphostrongylus tenuis TaxID=148309 RepID=A0AAD5QEF4_PARTN|nr:hypothetical protein KIN20_004406 [Parelaphostrongylus tenuis]